MRKLIGVLTAAVLATGGCSTGREQAGDGRNDDGGPGTTAGAGGPEPAVELVELRVLADESLTGAFTQIEQGFEMLNPSIEVVLTYGNGGNLVESAADSGKPDLVATDEPGALRQVPGTPEEIGRLRVVTLDGAEGAAATFTTFLKEGDGKRILIDSGLMRQ